MTIEIAVAVYVAGFFAVLIYAGYRGLHAGQWGAGAIIWPIVFGYYAALAVIFSLHWIAFAAPLRLGRWMRSLRHD